MVSLCVNVTLNVEAVAYTFTGPGANFIFMHSFVYVKSNHVSDLYLVLLIGVTIVIY